MAVADVLSMLAILLLPRQWQVAVVENVDERHIRKAMWLFPLYLLLINVFVLPIAVAGLLTFGDGGTDADAFVLALPLADQQPALALLVFIGGLSAATGMVIVETIALSTMVSNSLVHADPAALGRRAGPSAGDLGGLILGIRRAHDRPGAAARLRLLPPRRRRPRPGVHRSDLVRRGGAVRPGDPRWPVLEGARRGAAPSRGSSAGFAVWVYTLPLPSLVQAGWLSPASFVAEGPFGLGILAPVRVVRAGPGWTPSATPCCGACWSTSACSSACRWPARRDPAEHVQARDVRRRASRVLGSGADARLWRGTAAVGELQGLLGRFLGRDGRASRADGVRRPHRRRRLAGRRRGRRPGAPRRDPARRRGGIGVRAVHGRVGRGRGTARRSAR